MTLNGSLSLHDFSDVVSICTLEEDEGTNQEETHGCWRGWTLYHLHHDQGAASRDALSSALRHLAPLQSHAHTALTNATLLVAEVGYFYYNIIISHLRSSAKTLIS